MCQKKENLGRMLRIYQAIILKFADDSDTEQNSVGAELPDVSWVASIHGRLVSRQGAGGVSDSSTSAEFSGKDRYLALVYATGDSDQSNLHHFI